MDGTRLQSPQARAFSDRMGSPGLGKCVFNQAPGARSPEADQSETPEMLKHGVKLTRSCSVFLLPQRSPRAMNAGGADASRMTRRFDGR
jgi:hypothetical protein